MLKRTLFQVFGLFFLVITVLITPAQAKRLPVKPFPIEVINPELKNAKNYKIVVFMPTISDQTEYSSMLVQAFKHYFVSKLAFAPEVRDQVKLDIVLLTQKDVPLYQEGKQPVASSTTDQFIVPSFGLMADEKMLADIRTQIYSNLYDTKGMTVKKSIDPKLTTLLALPDLNNPDANSILFLLDENNRVVLKDDEYRGQGEHLKPLEHTIKTMLKLPVPKYIATQGKALQVGSMAPDVALMDGKKLSDYKGSVVVLAFYPAAFSGTFNAGQMVEKEARSRQFAMMSCVGEIRSLYRAIDAAPGKMLSVFFTISESTPELLTLWRSIFERQLNTGYVNDQDYAIAQAYSAIHSTKSGAYYHDRTTVIVDQNGKIAYLNKDYQYQDESIVQQVIAKLLKK